MWGWGLGLGAGGVRVHDEGPSGVVLRSISVCRSGFRSCAYKRLTLTSQFARQNLVRSTAAPEVWAFEQTEKPAYIQALHGRDLPEEDIRMLNKAIPGLLFDLRSAGEAFEDMKQMGLSGALPLSEVKIRVWYFDGA